MKNRIFVTHCLLSLLVGTLSAQELIFHGRAKNSIYSYESDKAHTRIYQYTNFNLATANKGIVVNTSLRALTDANEALAAEQRFKAYTANLELNNLLWNRLDLVLGRQFLHPGTVLGALDGLYGKVKILKKLSLDFYTGTESHFERSLKIYETKDNFVAGGLLQLQRFFATNLQLLYLQKSNDQDIFWELAGLNLDNASIPRTRLRVQSHYDLQNERMHRLLVSARHRLMDKVSLMLEYKNQYPQIYANSYFTIFSPQVYTQYRAGVTFEFVSGYFLNTQYRMVQFEDGNATKVFVDVSNKNGAIGFVYESGYAGDQLGLMLDYTYEFSSQIIASVSLDYSKYRTEEIYEYDNQLCNATRLEYRLGRNWIIDLEYQWLTNRFKQSDSRLLNHISFRW